MRYLITSSSTCSNETESEESQHMQSSYNVNLFFDIYDIKMVSTLSLNSMQ